MPKRLAAQPSVAQPIALALCGGVEPQGGLYPTTLRLLENGQSNLSEGYAQQQMVPP